MKAHKHTDDTRLTYERIKKIGCFKCGLKARTFMCEVEKIDQDTGIIIERQFVCFKCSQKEVNNGNQII